MSDMSCLLTFSILLLVCGIRIYLHLQSNFRPARIFLENFSAVISLRVELQDDAKTGDKILLVSLNGAFPSTESIPSDVVQHVRFQN